MVVRALVAAAVLMLAFPASGAPTPVDADPADPLDAIRTMQNDAILAARGWLTFLDGWDGSPADVPIPDAEAAPAVIGAMMADPAYAQTMIDQLGIELSTYIGMVRQAQLSGQSPEDLAQLILTLLPNMQAIAAGLPPFPAEAGEDGSLCPNQDQPPSGGTAVMGSYGSGAGDVCILGTGDDSYVTVGSSFGHLGGLAIELGGDDEYVTEGWSFGALGGAFVDLGGNDRYTTWAPGTSGPGPISFAAAGVMVEGAGDDTLVAGVSALADLGGQFVDVGGDDEYQTDSGAGVGSGSMGGRGGVLVELSGDDTYFQRNGGGGGVNSGTLMDLGGNDVYGMAPNTRHGFGVLGGLFFDLWGDDTYDLAKSSGASRGGMFIDGGGDDAYMAGTGSISGSEGTSVPNAGGLFMEWGGSDDYTFTTDPGHIEPGNLLPGQGALFIDTEAPEGKQFNGKVISGGQVEEDRTLPTGVPSPYAAWAQQAFDATYTSKTEVVGLGPSTLGFTVSSQMPVHVYGRDDAGGRVDFGTDGLVLAGSAELTGTYQPAARGAKTLYIVFEDALGLYELQRVEAGTIVVDGIEPSLTFSFDDGQGGNQGQWHSETSASDGLTVEVEDSESGIQALYFDSDQPPTTQRFAASVQPTGKADMGTISHTIPMKDMPEGTVTYHALAVDGAGNEATGQLTLRIDRTAPDAAITLSGGTMGNNGWYTQGPTVELSADDDAAGMGGMAYGWSGAASGSGLGSGKGPWTITPTWSDGTAVLEASVYDKAHPANTASLDAEIKTDGTAPTATIDMGALLAPVTGSIEGQDAASQVDAVQVRAWRTGSAAPAFQDTSSFTLTSPGTWHVEYRVTDRAGNTLQAQQDFDVPNQDPTVTAQVDSPTAPTGQLVTFSADAADVDGTIVDVLWDISGSPAVGDVVQYAFVDDGTYTATVTVVDDLGAQASDTIEVTITNRAPTIAIDGPILADRANDAVFQADAQDSDGTVHLVTWELAGGRTDEGTVVSHRFHTLGTFEISATATDDDGATTRTQHTVTVENLEPAINASGPGRLSLDQSGVFSATATDDDGPTPKVVWTFYDGTVEGADVTRSFQTPGLFTAIASAVDADGSVTSTPVDFEVVDRFPPQAAIAAPTQTVWGEPLPFEDASQAGDLPITSWHWRFGDGTTSTDARPTHTYSARGDYLVHLTVSDRDGRKDSASVPLHVAGRPPIVQVHADDRILTGEPPSISIRVDDPDGTTIVPEWRIVDDQGELVATGTGQPRHDFTVPGTYEVIAVAVDDDGMQGVDQTTIQVDNRAPLVSLEKVEPVLPGTVVTFDHAATDAEGAVDVSFAYGDGTSGGPSHTYTTPGVYHVVLTVTDEHGATAEATTQVEVLNRAPTAAMLVNAVSFKTGDTVRLRDISSDPDGETLTRQWTIDGAPLEPDMEVEYTLDDPGRFTIELTVVDPHGASSSASRTVTVHNRPPSLTVDVPDTGVPGGDIILTATASDPDGQIESIHWRLGSQTHTGATWPLRLPAGLHGVIVTAVDDAGESVKVVEQILIAQPVVEPESANEGAGPQEDHTSTPSSDDGTRKGVENATATTTQDKGAPWPFAAVVAALWIATRRLR